MTLKERKKFQRLKKVLSPASFEVLARRDSVRSKMGSQRMSRKTLQFQSPIDIPNVSNVTNADPGIIIHSPGDSEVREAEG